MTRDTLTAQISGLADAVLADWRWTRDDLNVSVLGMLLYGFAAAGAREMGLSAADVDAAVLQCLTDRIGAAAKWSGVCTWNRRSFWRGLVTNRHAIRLAMERTADDRLSQAPTLWRSCEGRTTIKWFSDARRRSCFEQELIELQLLEYCRPSLDGRF